MSALGVCSWGMSALGVCGVSAPVWGGGVLPGVVVVSQYALRQTPPVKRITDTSKNITLATTSLRPVITLHIPCVISQKFLLQAA